MAQGDEARFAWLRGPARPYAEVLLCVGVWAALGWGFRLGPRAYLVLGVPITFAFQRFVRRQPLRAMWVADAPPFRLGASGKAITIALALVPILSALGAAAERDWATCAWAVCATGGAPAAAYALRHFRRESIRPLLGCLLINSAIDAVTWATLIALGGDEVTLGNATLGGRVTGAITSLIVYIPVVFVMEEVFFRGVVDPHVYRPGQGRGRGWGSALFVAALWGLWHLPVLEEKLSLASVAMLLFIHCPFGVVLSLYWRKTGTLVVPGLSHAFSDALRDAIFSAD